MELRGDIELKHPVWRSLEQLWNNPNSIIVCFNRLVDLYIVACTIGIYYDSLIENDGELVSSINRNTYQLNSDVSSIFDFLFQNAVLTTSTIEYDIETKMRIAFDPDFYLKEFNPIQFLTKFANYGANRLVEFVSKSDIGSIASILQFLDGLISDDFDELLSKISTNSLETQRSN